MPAIALAYELAVQSGGLIIPVARACISDQTEASPRPEPALNYQPKPVDTSNIQLSPQILSLTEMLARNAHEVWARQRIADGWRLGPKRDDARKEHPCLIAYEDLPESEKQYDRNAALETLKTILALGYRIQPPEVR